MHTHICVYEFSVDLFVTFAFPEWGNLKFNKCQEDTPEVYGQNREFYTLWKYTIYLFRVK